MPAKRVSKAQAGLSEDTRTVLVILTLIFTYPIGLILMYLWTKWPMWVKLIISTPVLLLILAIFALFLTLSFSNII